MILNIITLLSVIAAGLMLCFCKGLAGASALFAALGAFVGTYLILLALAFLFLVTICAIVDMKKPQETDNKFYRFWMYHYIDALIRLVGIRLTTEGLEKTPEDGRFLLVCNHQNHADPGVLHHCFRKSNLAFIAKRESAEFFVVGPIMHKTLCQFINRENDRAALKTILRCIQIIKDDVASVAVFPEGGIIEDYKVYPFRSGALKIAQKAKVPIVVCTLKGTTELFRNMKRMKPTHIRMHLLVVIPYEQLEGKSTVEIGERIHRMMIDDLGEDWLPTLE